ncbi:NAD-dependent epimerase/dehydratase family protein [Halosimplex pelagicum]|uniref:NAD-dependent epimerase/dehydratase family protein n=1 Tax=Halosimplex pelagicum TaxID=869886 RepID=A0A7D5P928_9EURY|nr:NAD-dependent epimerase/dehydratase family protein [Halosimplex pelagicum]QLH81824.1 NAD-dependent epimerase/dehydratase family protein [Halosimplex pelagicum]
MTRHALFVGGTRFIGRRAVREFRDAGYDVTVFHRGEHESPFADDEAVDHLQGDRTDDGDLADAAAVDPDVVVDLVAYHPEQVRTATGVFDDADAYVYVSSGAAYGEEAVPKREDETALEPCSDEQATDDSGATYGARKAEGDRAVFAAAEQGVNALSVRPCVVYGPHDYTRRFDYWVQRVANCDRVLVPGDGTNLWHRVSVENVARALRVVAEEGTPGEAYNVGDWTLQTLRETVETVADALDTDVEVVTAGERELAAGGLDPSDFPLYRDPPHVLDTNKLRSLGWDPQAPTEAVAETVDATPERDADEAQQGPDRAAEERVLGVLETL